MIWIYLLLVISNKTGLNLKRISKKEFEDLKHIMFMSIETFVKDNKNLNEIFKIFIDDIEMKLLRKKLILVMKTD